VVARSSGRPPAADDPLPTAACSGDSVAALAHELRNPLAAVKALVQLVLRGEDDVRTRGRLDVVLTEVQRMESLLRAPAAGEPPAVDVVDPGALVDDVIAVLEARAAAAEVALVRSRRGDPASIAGDGPRLKAALLNLVGNAVEATPAGGRVELEITAGDGRVDIEVRDTGAGIAADDLARIGTPFFSRRAGGTGLGVLIARATIEQHGGRLDYRSQLGAGTTARVSLPVRPPAAPAHRIPESSGPCRSGAAPIV
jgi:signal transduction histidine kinase